MVLRSWKGKNPLLSFAFLFSLFVERWTVLFWYEPYSVRCTYRPTFWCGGCVSLDCLARQWTIFGVLFFLVVAQCTARCNMVRFIHTQKLQQTFVRELDFDIPSTFENRGCILPWESILNNPNLASLITNDERYTLCALIFLYFTQQIVIGYYSVLEYGNGDNIWLFLVYFPFFYAFGVYQVAMFWKWYETFLTVKRLSEDIKYLQVFAPFFRSLFSFRFCVRKKKTKKVRDISQ